MKRAILALSACSIAILPAQTAAPEKPATEKAEMAAEPTAETPVEKQVFKMFALLETLPEIMGSITDEASIAEAEEKFAELIKKIRIEEAALLKLEIPDNDARIKLSKKLKMKEEAISAKMQKLDPAVAMKLIPMMQKFAPEMAQNDANVGKYFKTDEELAKDDK